MHVGTHHIQLQVPAPVGVAPNPSSSVVYAIVESPAPCLLAGIMRKDWHLTRLYVQPWSRLGNRENARLSAHGSSNESLPRRGRAAAAADEESIVAAYSLLLFFC